MNLPEHISNVLTYTHLRIALMYVSYGCGVLVYIHAFPEKFFPGKFNIWVR